MDLGISNITVVIDCTRSELGKPVIDPSSISEMSDNSSNEST